MTTIGFEYTQNQAGITVDLDPTRMERATVQIPPSINTPTESPERIAVEVTPACAGEGLLLWLNYYGGALYVNAAGDLFVVKDPNRPAEMTLVIQSQKHVLRLLDAETIKRLIFFGQAGG